nr:RNA degradosome polyphosphate kinase [Lachnospiraceae bacterium]
MANWLKDLETAGFVCCILQNTASEDTKAFLADTLALSRDAIFESKYVDLRFFSEVLKERTETAHETMAESSSDPFGAGTFNFLSKRDRLCCVPYDSFNEVLSFLGEAASDPDVISIRQTLYRTGRESAVTDLLCRAAQNGKEVIVLMELRARYDEERNLENTKKLMASGAKVIFGRAGLKTHCKLLLVERKEQGGIRRYAHISTGNYNEFTAKTYTDVGLFTASTGICDDVLSLFEYAAGYGNKPDLYSLTASPFGLKEEFLRLIERERFNAGNGKAAEITAKINSLCDRDIIDALLSAAASGVKVTLIVRGICCFRPSRPGLNDNLTVLSVVGKQLEHSRIFRFRNGGNTEYYCSSADWMPRNFEGRIEVLFPIWDKSAQRKLESVLNRLSEGSIDTGQLTPTGEYIPTSGKTGSAQEDLTGLIGGMD